MVQPRWHALSLNAKRLTTMKKYITILLACVAANSASAVLVDLDPIEGTFTEGPLSGLAIEGSIEIETNGFESGIADTELPALEGEIINFNFTVDPFGTPIFFELFDDSGFPTVTFSNNEIVGFDYAGVNGDGDSLNLFYDAFASDADTGIYVEFVSFEGDASYGTLNLPTNVPEPSTYALLFGSAALALAFVRRRLAK